MNNTIKQIEVDVYTPTFYEVIKAQQGDKNSRFVEFILYDQGDPYIIPKGTIIKLEGSRPNKSPVVKKCTIKDNIVTIELDADLLYYHGISHLKIVLYEPDESAVLSTIPFTLSVQKNPLDSDKFEKDNYSLLNQLILEAEANTKKINDHINDNDNPHTIMYKEAETLTKLTVGEKLSDTFGKLSKAVSELISHINDNVRHITSTERTNWDDAHSKRHTHSNETVLNNTTASYTIEEKSKLNGIQSGAEVNVQSDWDVSDTNSDAFIKNKPSVYTKNEVDNKFSTLETNIDWKESVETYTDIAKTYPNPQDGWTVNVKDTDYTYRYSGTNWVAISANAIPKATNAVDGLLSKEDHANYDDANSKKHSHSNKSVLDKITQTLLDNWNTVGNKVDKISGKGLSTNDYTDNDKNIVESISNGTVIGVKGDAESSYRQGNVNITAANIGALGVNANAVSATKLATARTISTSGDVVSSGTFDGSANLTLSTIRRGCIVGQVGNTAPKPYYKVASISTSVVNYDGAITFKVSTNYGDSSTKLGILTAHFRTAESATSGLSISAQLVWEYAISGIDVSKFILANSTSTSPAVVEIWAICDVPYQHLHFDVIAEGTRTSRSTNLWTLYNTQSVGSQSAVTSGYTSKTSTLSTLKNPISGLATVATTGNYDDLSNKPVLGIKYENTKSSNISSGNTTKIIDASINDNGTFLIYVFLDYQITSATGNRQLLLYKNGVAIDDARMEISANPNGWTRINTCYPTTLSSSDSISVYGYQNSGSSCNVTCSIKFVKII